MNTENNATEYESGSIVHIEGETAGLGWVLGYILPIDAQSLALEL